MVIEVDRSLNVIPSQHCASLTLLAEVVSSFRKVTPPQDSVCVIVDRDGQFLYEHNTATRVCVIVDRDGQFIYEHITPPQECVSLLTEMDNSFKNITSPQNCMCHW